MNCPICNIKLENTYSDYLDGHILMESEYKCKSGHYLTFFVTGYWEEGIGNFYFYSGYTGNEGWSYKEKFRCSLFTRTIRKLVIKLNKTRILLERTYKKWNQKSYPKKN